jgi:hypothetical protein
MFNKTSQIIIPKLLCLGISLLMLMQLSSCQIAEESFTKFTNFTMDIAGKMTFNRKVLDSELETLKDESSYSFILGKIKEFNDQNLIIKESAGMNFTKEKSEDIVFMDQNATKLTFKFSFNTTTEDKFYNPKGILNVYVYFFKKYQGVKKHELSSSKLYFSYNLTDYEFCHTNSILTNCIQTPATQNNTAVNKIGKYLEFEFAFASSANKNYKVFVDMNLGITEAGDFLYVMLSDFIKDGELREIESKDVKLNKDKAIMRFPKFNKSIVVSYFIDTNFAEIIIDDKTSNIIKHKTDAGVEISIDPKGGLLTFTKSDADPNKSMFLQISLVSVSELDKARNALGTFNNMDHFIKNFTVFSFKTEEFKKDIYEKIDVRKTRFYLKGIPKLDTIIYGDLIIFEGKGTILLDGSRGTDIEPGNIKLHLEVLNWPFCRYNSFGSAQNCPAEKLDDPPKEGTRLEMKVNISGKIAPYRLAYSEDRYSMGDLSYIFTGNVNVDDRIEKVNNENVKVDKREKYNIITTNFPLFSKKASIQLIIDMNKPEGPYTLYIVLIGLLAVFSASFIVFMCISKKIKKVNGDPSLLPK